MENTLVFSVDRITNNVAVLVDDEGNSRLVSLADLPVEVRPGDVLRFCDGVFTPDGEEKARRQAYVSDLQNRLRRKK